MYGVEINEKLLGYFSECYGIGSESLVVEQKIMTSSGQETIQVWPGTTSWTPVILRRGITASMEVWTWRELVVKGQVSSARVAMTITMVDPDYNVLAQWLFKNAWPSKVSGPMVPALGAEIGRHAIEELTIVHEGMERVK